MGGEGRKRYGRSGERPQRGVMRLGRIADLRLLLPLGGIALFLIFSSRAAEGALSGLRLAAEVLIPSLFPVGVLSGCLLRMGPEERIRGALRLEPDTMRIIGSIRFRTLRVRTAEGELVLDLTGKLSGRGAYLCPDPACLKKAVKAKAIERALSCPIPAEIYEKLGEQMEAGE